MTNEQKLNYIKTQFNNHISDIGTLADFKEFLEKFTKARVITALKNRIDKDLETHIGYEDEAKRRIAELNEFKDQIDQFLN